MSYTRRDLAEMQLSQVKGISDALAEKCEKAGLNSVDDLLSFYPKRYLDRTKQVSIGELFPGEQATIYATVEAVSTRRTKSRKTMVEALVADQSSRVKVTFFNQPWRAKQLKVGTQAAFFGKTNEYRGQTQLVNPIVDIIREEQDLDSAGTILPIYPQSPKADLLTWNVRKLLEIVLPYADELVEILDESTKEKLKLVSRKQAYRYIHQPQSEEQARQGARRLRFDEFLMLQMVLVSKYIAQEENLKSQSLDNESLEQEFISNLDFELTGSQKEAISQIDIDMSRYHPMHRLLQGDVGSGKTVVAFAGALRAVGSGAQAVIMAPTEVLAKQHLKNAKKYFEDLKINDTTNLLGTRPVSVELLTNSTSSSDRERIARNLRNGNCDVLICTHALLYNEWEFANLGLVVIDEQHRFGVEQRSAILSRADLTPHMIVMSATPIPRTAAMLYFGDLKNTVMKDMPKGRKPVKTKIAKTEKQIEKAFAKVRSEVEKGHQAYVVCALVNESEKVQAKSAVDFLQELRNTHLKDLKIDLVHGQMNAVDKEKAMNNFAHGNVDVLVSTTVIEVGVDVPNATVMVVQDADRFGLSQLHQLRGRVGRGGGDSYCFLLTDKDSQNVQNRLEAMESTNDGFELAEIDLELRGAGHILGGMQSGQGDLKLGRLPRDAKYVTYAREVATEILKDDPTMSDERNRALAVEISRFVQMNDIDFLFKS